MNVQTVHFVSTSVADTIQLGTYLGQLLQRGDVILLAGDLGAGKTHFSKGVVAGIGSSDSVTSPTFVFINEYRGPQRLPIFHADLYRINTPAELIGIGITDATDGHTVSALSSGPNAIPACVTCRTSPYTSPMSTSIRAVLASTHTGAAHCTS
jgi:tRNA threonylcarbamoyladenosine biosynthesis protein TsaE